MCSGSAYLQETQTMIIVPLTTHTQTHTCRRVEQKEKGFLIIIQKVRGQRQENEEIIKGKEDAKA